MWKDGSLVFVFVDTRIHNLCDALKFFPSPSREVEFQELEESPSIASFRSDVKNDCALAVMSLSKSGAAFFGKDITIR